MLNWETDKENGASRHSDAPFFKMFKHGCFSGGIGYDIVGGSSV